MKICVYFNPRIENDNFEGTRLRKTIKGALELSNVPYTSSTIDNYEIIHFLSLNDEAKINDALENGKKVVFSALYCEDDKTTKCTYEKNEEIKLLDKAKRIFNRLDLIMVPTSGAKDFLIKEGIKTSIKVIPLSVNKERFQINNRLDEELFYNYFQIDKVTKYICTVGDYTNNKTITTLSSIAALSPKYIFFFFGQTKGKYSASTLYRLKKKVPTNLKLCPVMSDEIYCSMMKNAQMYFAFDKKKFTSIALFDAASSKTQIITIEPLGNNASLLEDLGSLVAKDINDLATIINSYMEGNINSTINKAYNYACRHSLKVFGKNLKTTYEKLLEGDK